MQGDHSAEHGSGGGCGARCPVDPGPGFKQGNDKVVFKILASILVPALHGLVDKYSSFSGGQEGEEYTSFMSELETILGPAQFGTFSSSKMAIQTAGNLPAALGHLRAVLGFNHDTGKFE